MRRGQEVRTDRRVALTSEWLLGNGLGGSASGTPSGAGTRTAHSYLTACGTHGRLTALLLGLEERLVGNEGTHLLAASPGVRAGAGADARADIEGFRLEPWPIWRYRCASVVLEKSLIMIYGHNATVVHYRHLSGPEARLRVCPLFAARDPEELQREVPTARVIPPLVPGRLKIEIDPGHPTLTVWHNGAFMPASAWRQRTVATAKSDATKTTEAAFVAGFIEGALLPGTALQMIASTEEHLLRVLAQEDRLGSPPPRTLSECVAAIENGERDRGLVWRRAALTAANHTTHQASAARATAGGAATASKALALGIGGIDAGPPERILDEADPWIGSCAEALRLGLVRRDNRLTLVPSLPESRESPADALRATMALITLRGFDAARDVIRGAVEYLNEGLAPEGFDPDNGAPRYGDPASALWLVIVAELYVRRGQDLEFAKASLYPAAEGIMHSYRSGTRFGLHVGNDGLLVTGESRDASAPADLNALWYHALVAMAQFSRLLGSKQNSAFYLAWARQLQDRFNEVLWNETHGYLHAAMQSERPVAGLGPSQLYAVSLPPAVLPPERASRLVTTIERYLFTPFGLRNKPGSNRVSTAWLGPFFTAYLRVHGRTTEAQSRVRRWLEELGQGLEGGVDGQLPAGFELKPGDGKPKTATRGAGSSGPEPTKDATTVQPVGDPLSVLAAAEILRVWVEELDHAPVAATQ